MKHYNTLSGQHQDHIMTEKELIELSDLIGVTSPYYLRAVIAINGSSTSLSLYPHHAVCRQDQGKF